MATQEPTNPRTTDNHSFTPRAVKIRNHLFNRMQWKPLVDITLVTERADELFLRLEINLDPASDYSLAIPESIMARLGVDAEVTTIKTGTPGPNGADPAFLCRVHYESTNIEDIEGQNSLASPSPPTATSEFNGVNVDTNPSDSDFS